MDFRRPGLRVCVPDGSHFKRQVTAMDGDEELETTSSHWKLLALDGFSSDLCQACQRGRGVVLYPTSDLHCGTSSCSPCQEPPSQAIAQVGLIAV